MKKKKLFILIGLFFIIISTPYVIRFILVYPRLKAAQTYTEYRISATGDEYWCMVSYGLYKKNDSLAFLIIQRTKLGRGIPEVSSREFSYLPLFGPQGNVYNVDKSTKVPNSEYFMYEILYAERSGPFIAAKSKEKVPVAIIESYFNTKRSDYSIKSLLEYYNKKKYNRVKGSL